MEEVVAVGGESLARDLHVAAPQLQGLLQQRGLGAQLLRGVAWAHEHHTWRPVGAGPGGSPVMSSPEMLTLWK